jgi:hypothetical protein
MTNHNTLCYSITKFIQDGDIAFHHLRIYQRQRGYDVVKARIVNCVTQSELYQT